MSAPNAVDRPAPVRRRFLPNPVWSGILAVTWLSMNGTLSAGHLLLAGALGWGLPYALQGFWPPGRRRISHPLRAAWKSLAYGLFVAADVVVANLQVARAVLSPIRRLRPGFAVVPIELRDARAIAILAHTITLTPGTVSVEVSPDRRTILIHALDMPDPAETVRALKQRYERRLMEIYAC